MAKQSISDKDRNSILLYLQSKEPNFPEAKLPELKENVHISGDLYKVIDALIMDDLVHSYPGDFDPPHRLDTLKLYLSLAGSAKVEKLQRDGWYLGDF